MTGKIDLIEHFRKGNVLFDGAMGSMLIAKGLQTGKPPEEWNRSKPSIVLQIHKSYLEAGAHIIETNTFGSTPSRMASFGLGDEAGELNVAAVRLAREAIAGFNHDRSGKKGVAKSNNEIVPGSAGRFVAFSIGPTGKMLPPVGNASEEEIRAEFTHQIESIRNDVDLFLIETIFDTREGIIALDAAKALTTVPVAVTLTFSKNPRGFFTIMGDEAKDAIGKLERTGADIVGANCTIASKDMVELARILRDSTSLPILCQPNAGSPTVKGGIPVYEQRPEEFADDAIRILAEGINAVGGCCGTTPEFIREAADRMIRR
ncbi:MAG: 5-methyltetrahydrofolate--homocysteine methyltransferase [Candidatus Latescibacteria bacterium]|nr:5-methyltetrahydrofolate--homocysteine methyltransferase [Candidatus Latescibacterota bacterium]NIM66307.1 5-methyltetrahydrofolate--homocysteine methyltransferase [Candidatus Latescibacterota bacterium]NIO02786.1 5-methyltetrahydrofolate--homocysteine methyltransferase [Candidatus Latescibacterota bacterium]NIO29921.1 5-methyltetrahydrofolate--homocysteine methyltransferase [Candidatus Latescibacterota bacterium]NIO57536.1 5-methyltetrahydrofolate--homocysteine methyltransferase [Candidatus